MKVDRVAPGMTKFLAAPAICDSFGSFSTFWSYSCSTM